jgi:hypothetical protein
MPAVARWSRPGLRVGASEVTGSERGKDRRIYQDAGAVESVDSLDSGMASTFVHPPQRLRVTMAGIRDALVWRAELIVGGALELFSGVVVPA